MEEQKIILNYLQSYDFNLQDAITCTNKMYVCMHNIKLYILLKTQIK